MADIEDMRSYFRAGITSGYEFRLRMLSRLMDVIDENEDQILEALHEDLGKAFFEGYVCEVSMVRQEITYYMKHLKKLMRPRRVQTSLINFLSTSKIIRQPLGTVLIMSPWNYPFMLAMSPLAASMAAGNCTVLKTSRSSHHTSQIIRKLITENFPSEYIRIYEGSNEELLDIRFDKIFFTGSQKTGRLVMEKASRYLTPVVLELGGKSPCIVDESADVKVTSARIAWGKFLNAGQTCVAPDYVLVHRSLYQNLIEELRKQIGKMYTLDPVNSNEFPVIINQKHFDRLCALRDCGRIVYGGIADSTTLRISPTLIAEPDLSSPLMTEEIFGPLLPIIPFDDINEVIEVLRTKEHPLALYLFSRNRELIERVPNELVYGGGCINDCIVHLTNSRLPFGGVGNSGCGRYHGEFGFDAFSHTKGILHKTFTPDITVRYAPYRNRLSKIRKVL